jgi:uncharacterized protein (DUF2252 family)
MSASTLLGRLVFIRELMPQDLKLELKELNPKEAMKAAAFLATVVGSAHARQMDSRTRMSWRGTDIVTGRRTLTPLCGFGPRLSGS